MNEVPTMETANQTDIKIWLAQKAAGIVNGARRKGYGLPKDNFKRIVLLWQAWLDARDLVIINKKVLQEYDHSPAIMEEAEYRLQAEDISPLMRLMKEARLIESPAHTDSLLDIIGYTMTGAEVNGAEVPPPETEARKEELLKENQEPVAWYY